MPVECMRGACQSQTGTQGLRCRHVLPGRLAGARLITPIEGAMNCAPTGAASTVSAPRTRYGHARKADASVIAGEAVPSVFVYCRTAPLCVSVTVIAYWTFVEAAPSTQ